tara:strand:- start:11388 stop:12758 length:1371 start_codon:yes stop_codon:yes gene_type:complete
MNRITDFESLIKEERISGWGRKNFVNSKLINFRSTDEIQTFLNQSQDLKCIPRGLGRSYGDAAQINEEFVFNLNFCNGISVSGDKVTVGAGVSINQLLEAIVPLGFFLPVSPGSSKVTIGGAIAADVHGKNHHKDGSLGNHITRILIVTGDGKIKELKPTKGKDNKIDEHFWATVGGMGLTGIILEATISLIKVETAFMKVDTFICNDLNSLMDLMSSKDKEYSYSVAWIDSLHKKSRGVLTCGEHAKIVDLKNIDKDFLSYDPKNIGSAAKLIPNGILNKLTVKAFNELWFRKSSTLNRNIQTISEFFHPLDGVSNWNRIYGREGFYQYQFVVPYDNTNFVFKVLDTLKKFSAYSFLTVLKRFGNKNDAFLSFPKPGWTLALDLPGSNKDLLKVLQELDNELATLGGRIYLAKDTRQTSEIFKKTYSSYPKWKKVKNDMDPENIFQSDLSRRLEI